MSDTHYSWSDNEGERLLIFKKRTDEPFPLPLLGRWGH
ncbi:hypothetical protein JOE23_002986 [Amphibacillus cookii]|nr:hypothetical protein [Amphibacillus cookii]